MKTARKIKKVLMDKIDVTKIMKRVKAARISDEDQLLISKGLRLLRAAQDEIIEASAVEQEDLALIGEAVGSRLKQMREAKGLSQEKLEKLSRVSQSTISKIESGNRMVSVNEAKSLGKVLGVAPQFLIAGD